MSESKSHNHNHVTTSKNQEVNPINSSPIHGDFKNIPTNETSINWLRLSAIKHITQNNMLLTAFTDRTEILTVVIQTISFSSFLSLFYLIGYLNFSVVWVFIITSSFAFCEVRINGRKRMIQRHRRDHATMNSESTSKERENIDRKRARLDTNSTTNNTNTDKNSEKSPLSSDNDDNDERDMIASKSFQSMAKKISDMVLRKSIFETENFNTALLSMNVEKAEWLNSILSDLWPYLCVHIKDILKYNIEPMINEMQPQHLLKTFNFNEINLGSLSPRIKYVNAYRPRDAKSCSSERARGVILDVELDFCGDTDIKINCCMMPFGVQDVIFKGYARIELSPLLTMPPFFGSVAISFTESPVIDFNLTGLASIVELPFLNNILHGTIDKVVSKLFVQPHEFRTAMISVENFASLNYKAMDVMHPFPRGCIFVHVKRATDLVAKDNIKVGKIKLINGKSDPYTVIKIGSEEHTTSIKKQTLNPIWDEKFCLLVAKDPELQTVKVELWDDDEEQMGGNLITDVGKFSQPDELGRIQFSVSEIYPTQRVNIVDTLEETKHGEIEVDYYWLPLKKNFYFSPKKVGNRGNESIRYPNLQTTVVSVVVETVYDVPKFIQTRYPACKVSIDANKKTMLLPTTNLISFDKEFFYKNTDLYFPRKTITLKSHNNTPIAFCNFEVDISDPNKELSYYKEKIFHYHEDRYRSGKFPQIRAKIGIRVRRAVGEIDYQQVEGTISKS